MSKYLTRETPNIEIRTPTGVVMPLDTEGFSYYHYEDKGGESWKLDAGAECNRLLDYAEACEVGSMGFGETAQLAKDIRSIVARVAEFEELEKE